MARPGVEPEKAETAPNVIRPGYQITFVGNTFHGNHVEYKLRVTDPQGQVWLLHRRYREIRDLHEQMKLIYPKQVISFPPKKLFGNMDQEFIRAREADLERYMQHLISIEPHCTSHPFQTFFAIPQRQIKQRTAVIKPAPQTPVTERVEELFLPTETLLSYMKRNLLDLSQPSVGYMDDLDMEERHAIYNNILHESQHESNAGILSWPISQAARHEVTRYKNPPKWSHDIASLPKDQWEKWMFAPSISESEDILKLREWLPQLAAINDPGRPIHGVGSLYAEFPECTSPSEHYLGNSRTEMAHTAL